MREFLPRIQRRDVHPVGTVPNVRPLKPLVFDVLQTLSLGPAHAAWVLLPVPFVLFRVKQHAPAESKSIADRFAFRRHVRRGCSRPSRAQAFNSIPQPPLRPFLVPNACRAPWVIAISRPRITNHRDAFLLVRVIIECWI